MSNAHNHDPIHPSEHGEEFTRPLSVILRIVRQHLISSEFPLEEWNETDCFTCIAAAIACRNDEITSKEEWLLKDAINDALLVDGFKYATIWSMMNETDNYFGINDTNGAHHPLFFPLRDAWLDKLAKKFEMMEEMINQYEQDLDQPYQGE